MRPFSGSSSIVFSGTSADNDDDRVSTSTELATTMTLSSVAQALFVPADAWWWGWVSYFSSYGSRAHVIQLCIVIMCLALFIMMKKFTGGRR